MSEGCKVRKLEVRMFSSLFFVHCCDGRSGSSFMLCWLMQFCDLRLKLLYYKANFQCDFFLLSGKNIITFFFLKQQLLGHCLRIGESFKNDDTLKIFSDFFCSF